MFSRTAVYGTPKIALVAVLLIALSGGGWWYARGAISPAYKTPEEKKDVYVRFSMEVFDTISRKYWRKTAEADYAELYKLALAKAVGKPNEGVVLATSTRTGVAEMLDTEFRSTPDEKKKALAVDLATIVLANLPPQGRNQLLSQKQEQQFRDTANNVNRGKNLYTALSVADNASVEKVQEAFVAKKAELEASTTPEAKVALKEAERAHEVLTDTTTKAIYDQTKIEPSLVSRTIRGTALYINLSKVTPATFDEFMNTLQKTGDQPTLQGLILDMRGNVGGSLDFAKYLLALFVGPNQYAFDLFHQDEYNVERTPQVPQIPALKNFKEIAILTDGMTQSTAELTTAIFKRLNMATVVGAQTRGWGTVENTFPIKTQLDETETYSVLMVHSLTLREDGQPVEGRGIDPDVNTTDPAWKTKLSREFRSPVFVQAVIDVVVGR